jgi:phosphosulfolactate synthase (CoM biosynthesis protein A)
VTLPADDLVALTRRVRAAGLKAKPEVGIQFGAGGASAVETLEARGTREVDQAIELAKRHLDAGAHMIMIESEGSPSRCASGASMSPPVSPPTSGSTT